MDFTNPAACSVLRSVRLTRVDLALDSTCPPLPSPSPICLHRRATMGSTCIGLTAHRPSWRHRKYKAYWMFEAAKAGCMHCVNECLTDKKINPYVTSLTHNYTVLDYARFGSAKGNTTAENIVAMLDNMNHQFRNIQTRLSRMYPQREPKNNASDWKLTHLRGDIGSAPSTGCSKLRKTGV